MREVWCKKPPTRVGDIIGSVSARGPGIWARGEVVEILGPLSFKVRIIYEPTDGYWAGNTYEHFRTWHESWVWTIGGKKRTLREVLE